MKSNIHIEKGHAQYALLWYLKVGKFMGTFDQKQLVQTLNVKPLVLKRWMFGKLTISTLMLHKVKQLTFTPPRPNKSRKLLKKVKFGQHDEAIHKERYEWKLIIFDEMNRRAKYRFCKKLTRTFKTLK